MWVGQGSSLGAIDAPATVAWNPARISAENYAAAVSGGTVSLDQPGWLMTMAPMIGLVIVLYILTKRAKVNARASGGFDL